MTPDPPAAQQSTAPAWPGARGLRRALHFVFVMFLATGGLPALAQPAMATPPECNPAVSTVGAFTFLGFTTVGQCTWTPPDGLLSADIAMVGGGGAGSAPSYVYGVGGGGGGGGQVTFQENVALSGSYLVTVGAGGTANGAAEGADGNSSSFGPMTALGGRGGTLDGADGGLAAGGAGWPSQGAGGTGTSGTGGHGSSGSRLVVAAATIDWGGGGGGGAGLSGSGSSGGVGGGGGGGEKDCMNAGSGWANTGGGGGGAHYNTCAVDSRPLPGSGGDGGVLVSYVTEPTTLSGLAVTTPPRVGEQLVVDFTKVGGAAVRFQWYSSSTPSGTFEAIAGATSDKYVPGGAQHGRYLRVVLTPDRSDWGTSSEQLTLGSAVVHVAPTAGTAQITGANPDVGDTLTASMSGATGEDLSFTYQWRWADSAGGIYSDITGATSSTYVVASADFEKYLSVIVTAVNDGGSASSTSSATSQVSARSVTVTYDPNGGTGSLARGSDSFRVGLDSALALPGAGTLLRDGYTFGGWSTSPTGLAHVGGYSPTTTQTLYARWNADSHVVRFDPEGGSSVSDGLYYTGGSVSEPASPTRAGYVFDGWARVAAGSAVVFPHSPGLTQDIDFYALWSLAPPVVVPDSSASRSPAPATEPTPVAPRPSLSAPQDEPVAPPTMRASTTVVEPPAVPLDPPALESQADAIVEESTILDLALPAEVFGSALTVITAAVELSPVANAAIGASGDDSVIVAFDPMGTPEAQAASVAMVATGAALAGVAAAAAAGAAAAGAAAAGATAGVASQAGMSGSGAGSGGGMQRAETNEGALSAVVSADYDVAVGVGLRPGRWDGWKLWQSGLIARWDRATSRINLGVAPVSPLVAKLLADGVYARTLMGPLSALFPLAGIWLALEALDQQGDVLLHPPVALFLAIVTLGAFDAFAGTLAMTVYVVGSLGLVDPTSLTDWRLVAGIVVAGFGPILTARSIRDFRRAHDVSTDSWTRRVGDIAFASLMGGWVAGLVVSALPALTGLTLPAANYVTTFQLWATIAIALRVVLEIVAQNAMPRRFSALAPQEFPEPPATQQVFGHLARLGFYIFIASSFMGFGPIVAIAGALFMAPNLLALISDRLPNSRTLWRILPTGLVGLVMVLSIETVVGGVLEALWGDHPQFSMILVVTLLAVITMVSILGLTAREGAPRELHWTKAPKFRPIRPLAGVGVFLALMVLTGTV